MMRMQHQASFHPMKTEEKHMKTFTVDEVDDIFADGNSIVLPSITHKMSLVTEMGV
jgi:hypothetical protein